MKLRLFSGADRINQLYEGDLNNKQLNNVNKLILEKGGSNKASSKDLKQGKINRIKEKFIPKVKRRIEMTPVEKEISTKVSSHREEIERIDTVGYSEKFSNLSNGSNASSYGKSYDGNRQNSSNSLSNFTSKSIISDKLSTSSYTLQTNTATSNKSLNFALTNETKITESSQTALKATNDIKTNLTESRSINRRRSKTLDTADLMTNKTVTPSTVSSRFRHYSKVPPVTGKTRSKFKSRRHSSSSSDNLTAIVSDNNGNVPINETTKKKPSIINRIKSRSRSNSANSSFIHSNSNSNLSLYSSSKDSHDSDSSLNNDSSYYIGNTNLPQRIPPPPHSNSANTIQQQNGTTSSSTYSLSRRSSSIVNALSSFVNLRSTSVSSNKLPQISPSSTRQPNIALDDLPIPPEPEGGDEPFDKYLRRLSSYGKFIAIILTLKDNSYKLNCLNYYLTNYFEFINDPLDIALRKLLIFLELPKESQQIDRLLTEFGKVYFKQQKEQHSDKCLWTNEDQVYFIIFSLLMLHTDYFNNNNKVKMTKEDFIDLVHNDTYSDGNKVPVDILNYYYDNITSRESPKFEMPPVDNSVIAFDNSEEVDIYSPKDIIKNKTLIYDRTLETVCSSLATSLALSSNTNTINGNTSNSNNTNHPSSIASLSVSNNGTFFQNRSTQASISSYFTHSNSINLNSLILQDDINVYSHILQDNLLANSLSADIDTLLNNKPLINEDDDYYYFADDDDIDDESYYHDMNSESNQSNVKLPSGPNRKYNKFKLILNELKGGYIMLITTQLYKLKLPIKWEIINENKEVPHSYFKIIQISEIDELEGSSNVIEINNSGYNSGNGNINNSVVSSNLGNAKVKSKIAILTTCGILVYEKKKSTMDMIKEPKIVFDEKTGESNYIIKFKTGCEVISYHNLWAESICDLNSNTSSVENGIEIDVNGNITKESQNSDDYVINIWGPKFKLKWKCCNKAELDNIVNGINFMSSLEHCFYTNFKCLNNTVISTRSYDYKSKYDMIQNDKLTNIKKYKDELIKLELYRQCIPISYRCRIDLLNKVKLLINKINWLQYEIGKDMTYLNILRNLLKDNGSNDNKQRRKPRRKPKDKLNSSFDSKAGPCKEDDNKTKTDVQEKTNLSKDETLTSDTVSENILDEDFDTSKEYIKFIRFE